MAELSIKVSIAGRIYPLKVDTEQEEGIRKAADLINNKVRDYEENYAVRDKQDVLSMCALQLASELLVSNMQHSVGTGNLEQRILQIDELLNDYYIRK